MFLQNSHAKHSVICVSYDRRANTDRFPNITNRLIVLTVILFSARCELILHIYFMWKSAFEGLTVLGCLISSLVPARLIQWTNSADGQEGGGGTGEKLTRKHPLYHALILPKGDKFCDAIDDFYKRRTHKGVKFRFQHEIFAVYILVILVAINRLRVSPCAMRYKWNKRLQAVL
jgi:hypothetical protein